PPLDADRGRLFRNFLQVLASTGAFGRDQPRSAATSWGTSKVQSAGAQYHDTCFAPSQADARQRPSARAQTVVPRGSSIRHEVRPSGVRSPLASPAGATILGASQTR